ncbi:MAG: TIGR00730 family Rossman fold protein [Rhizobiaceae bacterium]|nr:TIGR00730 family Rossman fold protein [Rhizobiaceae bacterium]MCV0408081.1 TIGR00730 family Rossman fold protein [Rhizobiaceae bacterium]
MSKIRSVCVYCGSSPGRSPAYVEAGRELGRSIARHGIRLVYGGGARGVMGAVSAGTREAGGSVTGIIPAFLVRKESAEDTLDALDEAIVVDTMHQRKQAMFDRSDAFIALPGGLGTLEEIVEIMTWAQLGHHEKPIVFADIGGFWSPMSTLLERMNAEGFIHAGNRVRPIVVAQVDQIVPAILAAAPGALHEGHDAVIEKM